MIPKFTVSPGDIIITKNLFFSSIETRQKLLNSLLCVGLDPDPGRFPQRFNREPEPIFAFNKAVIDATADLCCCYKPQIAHYAANSAERQLEKTIRYTRDLGIPVILDAKRGDVASTAENYAREVFERYGADAVTINPYLGYDAMQPFLTYADKGVIILCRTSNPGGADIQNLVMEDGEQLFERVAELATVKWNVNNNVGLVVGATRPSELTRVREIAGEMTLLLPGIGAQGGDIAASIRAGEGGGLIIASSRAITYASSGDDFAEAARRIAQSTVDEINQHRR